MKATRNCVAGLILVFCLTASTCKKDAPPPALLPASKPLWEPEQSKLTLLWRTHLADNKKGAYSNNPILNSEGNILMSSLFNPNGREIFKLFDRVTGELKWKWDDYLRDEEDFSDRSHQLINDVLVLCAHNATYAFNIVTGQTVWKHFMQPGYGPGCPFIYADKEGYIYHSFYGETDDFANYILRTRYNEPNWELVYKFTDPTKSHDRISSKNIAVTSAKNGDQLLFFSTVLMNSSTDTKSILSCYNITTKKYEWQQDFSTSIYEWGTIPIVVGQHNLFVFATGKNASERWRLLAVNRENGTLAWNKPVPDFGVNLFTYKSAVIGLCNGNSAVKCFDQESGGLVWEQPFANENFSGNSLNFTFGDATVLKNYLFSTQCSNLLVLNLDNGHVLFNKQASVDGGCLQLGAAIHEKSRTFYVQDRTYVCCFKIPDEVKF